MGQQKRLENTQETPKMFGRV